MSIRIKKILSGDEFERLNKEGLANGFWNTDRHVFPPGSLWLCPWIYDPSGERQKLGKHVMIKASPEKLNDRSSHLSPHYWADWADKRPPITIVCPNGELWEPDRWSSNGDGWTVTGDLFKITCSPSIVVNGYHGFLQNGAFTPDLEGRGANGIARPYTPRKIEGAA